MLINSVTADTFISDISQTASFRANPIKTKKINYDNILMLHHLHNINSSVYDETNYFGKYDSIEIAKYALNGTKIWKKDYSLVSGLISDFTETPDKGFLLVGVIESNISFIKLDSIGNIVFRQDYPKHR